MNQKAFCLSCSSQLLLLTYAFVLGQITIAIMRLLNHYLQVMFLLWIFFFYKQCEMNSMVNVSMSMCLYLKSDTS